jgi:hypothetical protein
MYLENQILVSSKNSVISSIFLLTYHRIGGILKPSKERRTAIRMVKKMKMYRVEFSFAESFGQVDEWQTMDGLEAFEAESSEAAAKWAACTDGLEDALFKVYELAENEFGELEPVDLHTYEYFEFR